MTYDGSLSVSESNSVKIPNPRNITIANATGSPYSGQPTLFWSDANHYYYMDVRGSMRSDIKNPSSFYRTNNNALSFTSTTIFFAAVTPTAIGDYFYFYGATDDLGGSSGTMIARAHISSPQGIEDLSAVLANGYGGKGALYMDGSYVWLFGGNDGGTCNTIQRASYSDPTSWTVVGTLSEPKKNFAFGVVGSNLYIWGGNDDTSASTDTIITASVSDPTTWTSAGTLPSQLDGPIFYSDGTTVYLLGGSYLADATSNKILTASVSTPTSFTVQGTALPIGSDSGGMIIPTPSRLWMFLETDILTASTDDLLTWTTNAHSLAASSALTHVGVHNGNVYIFGGRGTSVGVATSSIQMATTEVPDFWTISTNTLPAPLSGGSIIKTSKYFYIIGGDGISGKYYRASLDTPTVWTLVSTAGPTVTGGKAFVRGDHAWYIGGEDGGGVPSTKLWRTPLANGEIINDWSFSVPVFSGGGTASIPGTSRFALVISGNFLYMIGGTSAGTAGTVWRASADNLYGTFNNMGVQGIPSGSGTLINQYNPIVLIINGYAYILGGYTNSTGTTFTGGGMYCSMQELASGEANFRTEQSFFNDNITAINGEAFVAGDNIFVVGVGTNSRVGTKFIYRSGVGSRHSIAMPRIPEGKDGLATIDNLNGTIGSYSAFQKQGMLPWTVTTK